MAAHLSGAVFENAVSRRGKRFVRVSRVGVGSQMDRYGFEEGDIVLVANRTAVETIDELAKAVALRANATELRIQRGNFAQTLLVQ